MLTSVVRDALMRDMTIDITTTGRRSGAPQRIEIWFLHVDAKVYITGTSGRRDWFANLLADPNLIFHLKESATADLAAIAENVVDPHERRAVFLAPGAEWYREQEDIDSLVAHAPMVRITFAERTWQLELTAGRTASDGEDIYWELACAGAGDDRPVVVLSHGAGGSHAVWYQQVPALAEHFRILTWDSRGFGNSTNRNDAPSADAAARDLAAVLDGLQLSRCHLVGQSMGGWHIAAFAKAYPERVLSLTFADTVGGLWTDPLRAAFATSSEARGITRSAAMVLGRHPALWEGTTQRNLAHAFLYQALGSFHTPPMDKLGATIAWTLPHETIAKLGVPVLFVAGTHDALFPARLIEESSRLIPAARFVEIAEAGHSPYFEQPAAWNEAVLSFLCSV